MPDKTKLPRAAEDDPPGACYITDKQTGQQRCHYLTKSACTDLGGVFYGGPCGPLDAIAPLDATKGTAAEKKVTPRKADTRRKRPK